MWVAAGGRALTLFALTNAAAASYLRGMSLERTLQVVQVGYPQVYHACHTRHQRKRTTAHRLSARDSSILAHLDVASETTPARLATHLGVARSTVSEATKRLDEMGYVRRRARKATEGERGGVGVTLTDKRVAALQETSVLETPRLRAVLETLSAAERRVVERGMSALARGCRRYADANPGWESR